MSDEVVYKQFTEKYRPKKLADVLGQRVAVGTLESMINSGKISPTIMLSGTFGCGKTSLARMIARYVNCETQKACGTCRSCLAMDKGNHPDVTELNAAESRGIDEVRNLIQVASLSPRFNKRIFIIDEFHALTPQGMQALLKPLEEPPPRTLWVLCTSEAQKVPATIRSRAQQIKLLPMTPKSLVLLLQRVCKAENLTYPDKALELISVLAEGHARNALMLLEQVQQYAESNGLPENLEEALPKIIDEMSSIPPEILVAKYVQLLVDGDYNALAAAARVEKAEYFLHIAFKYLRGIIFEMKGVSSSAEIQLFLSQTRFKRNFDHNHLTKLLELHLNGLEQAKRYGVEASDILDLVVLKSLEVMQTAPVR